MIHINFKMWVGVLCFTNKYHWITCVLGIAVLFSRDRKHIQWKSILILVLLNVFLAWFFVYFQIGRSIVEGLALPLLGLFNQLILEQVLHSVVLQVVNKWIWQ